MSYIPLSLFFFDILQAKCRKLRKQEKPFIINAGFSTIITMPPADINRLKDGEYYCLSYTHAIFL